MERENMTRENILLHWPTIVRNMRTWKKVCTGQQFPLRVKCATTLKKNAIQFFDCSQITFSDLKENQNEQNIERKKYFLPFLVFIQEKDLETIEKTAKNVRVMNRLAQQKHLTKGQDETLWLLQQQYENREKEIQHVAAIEAALKSFRFFQHATSLCFHGKAVVGQTRSMIKAVIQDWFKRFASNTHVV